MKKICVLLSLLTVTGLNHLQAQDTVEEDPFADYSYLWEKPEKKKKKKKKSKTEPVAIDSLVSEAGADSTQFETITESVADSLTQDMATLAADQAAQDSLNQIAKDEKRAERQEKVSGKKDPEDFRAGLPPLNSSGSINGGVTYSTIDGKAYVGMNIAPEFSIGKVGVGLDVPILYGLDDNKVRTEMFTDGVGVLRVIRYVRYGQQKIDPVYVKVGELTGLSIGYGGLVNNYSNSTSYEKRKIGLHYDVNYKGWGGIEGMYSDFDASSMNLLAIRPYVKPLRWLPTPIIRTLEVGATYIQDRDQTTLPGSSSDDPQKYVLTKDGVGALGFDAGMTLFRIPFMQVDLFANYSMLNLETQALEETLSLVSVDDSSFPSPNEFKKGTGASVGMNFRFHFIADLLSTDVRIERLTYSDFYMPQFFDASYELNKDNKILTSTLAEKQQGIYGSLTGHILKIVSLGGSLMLPDDISESSPATVTLHADVDRLANKFSIHANYFKGGLTDLNDAFKLDDNSLAKVRFAYHMNKFMVMGVDYFWTFTPTDDGYKATRYVSPFFGVSIPL
ncbi:hypothetical protein [Reichenbachiella versicolor]|uniref:hypothetical protein n=1 Tax=Reichenbachiella versicolor TaxID=1821036 RepID=UPI000D6E3FB8|nr:hypothetical protein [Reichenbachiella versicolor]